MAFVNIEAELTRAIEQHQPEKATQLLEQLFEYALTYIPGPIARPSAETCYRLYQELKAQRQTGVIY